MSNMHSDYSNSKLLETTRPVILMDMKQAQMARKDCPAWPPFITTWPVINQGNVQRIDDFQPRQLDAETHASYPADDIPKCTTVGSRHMQDVHLGITTGAQYIPHTKQNPHIRTPHQTRSTEETYSN